MWSLVTLEGWLLINRGGVTCKPHAFIKPDHKWKGGRSTWRLLSKGSTVLSDCVFEVKRFVLCFLQIKRQQRKLNFLITQTELYAHFMSRKLTGHTDDDRDKILTRLDEEEDKGDGGPRAVSGGVVTDFLGKNYGEDMQYKAAISFYQVVVMGDVFIIRLWYQVMRNIAVTKIVINVVYRFLFYPIRISFWAIKLGSVFHDIDVFNIRLWHCIVL